MNLTSLTYLAFLLLVVVCYYSMPRILQPYLLLLFSAYFYASFDVRFFIPLGFCIFITWLFGILLQKSKKSLVKKLFLTLGVLLNFIPLFFVKQFNTTASLFSKALALIGITIETPMFQILSPIGISFYTLTAIAYCVDTYRNKFPAQRNLAKFALFISFFPTILQGPILRYDTMESSLFPKERKKFDYTQFTYGCQLIVFGLFKKLVIADRSAFLVNEIFNHYTQYHGFTLLVGALFYSLQIYTDFSGCVDIVRGSSQILQIPLPNNFRQPYFATSIADFWHRWHISLSTWFRDYIYIPLGGDRKGKLRQYLNILIVFFISGLWHGAGLNFMLWGFLHGTYQVLGKLLTRPRQWLARRLGMGDHLSGSQFAVRRGCRRICQSVFTFFLVSLTWVFFRLPRWRDGIDYITQLFRLDNPWVLLDKSLFALGLGEPDFRILLVFAGILFVCSLLQSKFFVREKIAQMPIFLRWSIYLLGILCVVLFGIYGRGYVASDFIYGGF